MFTVLTYAVVTVLALFKGDTARMVKVSEKQLTGEKAGEEVMVEYTYRVRLLPNVNDFVDYRERIRTFKLLL